MAKARRRRGARMQPCSAVFFESADRRGTALLVEVSYSGARLELEGPCPGAGETVLLYVWPESQAEPFELAGRVVGSRPDGFAVEYEEVGQEICQWIDALETADPPARGPAAERAEAKR